MDAERFWIAVDLDYARWENRGPGVAWDLWCAALEMIDRLMLEVQNEER